MYDYIPLDRAQNRPAECRATMTCYQTAQGGIQPLYSRIPIISITHSMHLCVNLKEGREWKTL